MQIFRNILQDLRENLTTYVFYIFYSMYIIFGTFIMMSLYEVAPDFMIQNFYFLCGIFAVNFVLHTVFFMFYGKAPEAPQKKPSREETVLVNRNRRYNQSIKTISRVHQR